jgi:hypothetical protein
MIIIDSHHCYYDYDYDYDEIGGFGSRNPLHLTRRIFI